MVIGLKFGSRGAIPSFTWNNLKKIKFTASWLHNIAIDIIKNSLKILHHHLYFSPGT